MRAQENTREERPLSAWKKEDIIQRIEQFSKDNRISLSIAKLKGLDEEVLKSMFLQRALFSKSKNPPHAAPYYIDYRQVSLIRERDIDAFVAQVKWEKSEKEKSRRGGIAYTVSNVAYGRKTNEIRVLLDVNITFKDKDVIVTDDDGIELLRREFRENETTILYAPENLNSIRFLNNNLRSLYRNYWKSFSAIKRLAENQTRTGRHDVEIKYHGITLTNPWRDKFGREISDNEALRTRGWDVLNQFCQEALKYLKEHESDEPISEVKESAAPNKAAAQTYKDLDGREYESLSKLCKDNKIDYQKCYHYYKKSGDLEEAIRKCLQTPLKEKPNKSSSVRKSKGEKQVSATRAMKASKYTGPEAEKNYASWEDEIRYLDADDVSRLLKIGRSNAYRIIREVNGIIKKEHPNALIISGRVSFVDLKEYLRPQR